MYGGGNRKHFSKYSHVSEHEINEENFVLMKGCGNKMKSRKFYFHGEFTLRIQNHELNGFTI